MRSAVKDITLQDVRGRNNFRAREIRVLFANDDENRRSDNIAGNYAGTSDASCSSFVGESHSGPREAKHFGTPTYFGHTRVPFLLAAPRALPRSRRGYELLPRAE